MKLTVFGSIQIRSLPSTALPHLDRALEVGAHFLVGDAPGVDLAVQAYLQGKGYQNVTIYHRSASCRNNLGQWPTIAVPGTYTDRDHRMCSDADYGIAVWNGQSRGTGRNLRQLGRRCRVIRG